MCETTNISVCRNVNGMIRAPGNEGKTNESVGIFPEHFGKLESIPELWRGLTRRRTVPVTSYDTAPALNV